MCKFLIMSLCYWILCKLTKFIKILKMCFSICHYSVVLEVMKQQSFQSALEPMLRRVVSSMRLFYIYVDYGTCLDTYFKFFFVFVNRTSVHTCLALNIVFIVSCVIVLIVLHQGVKYRVCYPNSYILV